MEVECEYCGKKIERCSYKVKKNKRHFCDMECRNNWMREQSTNFAEKKKYMDKSWLEKKLIDEELTVRELCEEINKPRGTVEDWIQKHNIHHNKGKFECRVDGCDRTFNKKSTRTGHEQKGHGAKYQDKEWVSKKVEENKSIRGAINGICKECDIKSGTARKYLRKFDLLHEGSCGKVICKICGEKFGQITHTHLKKAHDMTAGEYKNRFPNAPTKSERMRKDIASSQKGEKNPMTREEVKKNREQWLEKAPKEEHPMWKGGKVEVECAVCGKTKKIKQNRYKRFDNFFCKECRSEWQTGENNMSWNSEKVECDNCGKVIYLSESRRKSGNHFCSRECFIEHQTQRVEKTCEYCGKEYKVKPSRKDTSRFCSRKCMIKWMEEAQLGGKNHPRWVKRVKINCENCGKEMKRLPSKISDHNFCSKECFYEWVSGKWGGKNNPAWKGGYEPYYGPNWHQQRRKVLERDDYTCQKCGKTKEENGRELDVHHIKPLKEFKDKNGNINYKEANKLSNLVSLCIECHAKAEKSN